MVEEIKVKVGYKKTEVGIIPEDWEVIELFDLTSRIGDGIHTTPNYVSNSEYYFINGNNLSNGKIIITEITKCVSYLEYLKHFRSLTNKTILMSINGTIGNLAYYNNEKVVLGKSACYINVDKTINNKYIYYQLSNRYITQFYNNELTGTTIRNLSLKTIRNTPIIIPSNIKEQKAIATVLTDTDNLITSLEKLIDKKKKIKQGTMQQLLTGKKRLPGFSGEWEVRKLGEISDCLDYLRVPLNESQRAEMKGNIPYCGANGVVDFVNDYCINDDIILLAEDGGYFDEFRTRPIAYRMTGKVWVNNHAHIIKAQKGTSQAYLFYNLVHKNILEYITGGTRAKLNKSSLLKIEIFMSNDITEQEKIANILEDIDSEIESLEEKLSKYKTIKQGMMQELLTGGIRLI